MLCCHIKLKEVCVGYKMKGKSFSFDPAEEEHTTYFTQVTLTELWHKRLDHCHLERMLNMKKGNMQKKI